MPKGRVTVTDRVAIHTAPAGPIHALDLWDAAGPERAAAALGFALPAPGRSAGDGQLRALRLKPAVWWLDGPLDPAALEQALAGTGAVTAIGGGLVRVRLEGAGWRALLMRDAVFDAEDPAFGPGCCAATLIAHVPVRLHVLAEAVCEVFVPASMAGHVLPGWRGDAHSG